MLKALQRLFQSQQAAVDWRKEGNAFLAGGELAQAERCYRQAVAVDAGDADARLNLGYVLIEQQRADEALRWLQEAVRLRPLQHDAHFLLARLAAAAGQREEALDAYARALAAQPDSQSTQLELANLLVEAQRYPEAAAHFDAVLKLQPAQPIALVGHANCLLAMDRNAEALTAYEQLLAVHPDHPQGYLNRGNALLALGRGDEALRSFEAAAQARPGYVPALVNIGAELLRRNRCAEATGPLRQALEHDAQSTEARWNLSQCLLLRGELEEGWVHYESRWQMGSLKPLRFPQPQWTGREDLRGKSILVYSEQGLGDSLQFARYAPLLADRGAKVFLWVQAPLRDVLADLDPRCSVVDELERVSGFDYHIPLLSLPLAFGTRTDSIPIGAPYIHSVPELVEVWRERLGHSPGLQIGIAWSGNPGHLNDSNRSLPLSALAGLARPGMRLVSLQKELRAGEEASLAAAGLMHFGGLLTDFRQTAALVDCMDLVVCVDTSVAHLAAAMGKPTWLLLPFTPDWRWLLERNDSPWYPSMRLFRQAGEGDWDSTLAQVQSALAGLVARTS